MISAPRGATAPQPVTQRLTGAERAGFGRVSNAQIQGQGYVTLGSGAAVKRDGQACSARTIEEGDVVEIAGPAVVGGYGPVCAVEEVDEFVAARPGLGRVQKGTTERWLKVYAGSVWHMSVWEKVD